MKGLIEIRPTFLSGELKIPKSKSAFHRMIICSALSIGESFRDKLILKDMSNDILTTIEAMTSIVKNDRIVRCGESGSTLRFLIPIVAALGQSTTFMLGKSLECRPLNVYEEVLPRFGVRIKKIDGALNVDGKLRAGKFIVRGDVSSQFISGLMFALPLLDSQSEIILSTKLESEPYVDMTVDILKKFGIEMKNTKQGWIVPGNQKYVYTDYDVEGDWSQAAFYFAANALGSQVNVLGLNSFSKQGDKEIIKFLTELGAAKFQSDKDVIIRKDKLVGTELDLSNTPDLAPIISVVAALCSGETRLYGLHRLRFKESDRLSAIIDCLERLGVYVRLTSDSLVITGEKFFCPAVLLGYNDHRIVMSMMIASTCAEGNIVITDPMSVNKSYPNFFQDCKSVGADFVLK